MYRIKLISFLHTITNNKSNSRIIGINNKSSKIKRNVSNKINLIFTPYYE